MKSRQAHSAPPGADQPRELRQWSLDRSLRAKGRIVIAVPLIALMGTTSADLLLQRDESLERNVSTAARALASEVLADSVNAETGVRIAPS
jgi:hypothetical protein